MDSDDWPPIDVDLHLLELTFDGLSDEQALRKVRATIRGLLVGEIRRCLVGVPVGEPIGLAALMLSLAAIDILGGIYRGSQATFVTFGDFVRDFMPGYDPTLMRELRNKVLHEYVIPAEIVVMYGDDRVAQHLGSAPEFPSKVVLHVPSVAEDIDRAAERMLLAAKADSVLARVIIDRTSSSLLMMGSV
jgi:hypothetical protein